MANRENSGLGGYHEYPKESWSTTDTAAINDAANSFALKITLLDFANKTSLVGPPFIISSTNWVARALWISLFVVGVGLTLYNVVENVIKFTSWPIETEISLNYSVLTFPMITMCNINPLRRSAVKNLSSDLQEFINGLNPDFLKINETISRRKRYISDDQYASKLNKTYRPSKYKNEGEIFGGTEDTNNQIIETFRYLYSLENKEMRTWSGHQIDEMLLSCSFETRSCDSSEFKLVVSNAFGNCYSFNGNGKYISKRSGQQYGLTLIVYLDLSEYIMGLTSGYGLRLSVNSQRLRPFPSLDGIYVSSGQDTDVGLRLANISRLSTPYGNCNDNDEYKKKYQTDYSRQFCIHTCSHQHILVRCKCFDRSQIRLYPVDTEDNYRRCSDDDFDCMSEVNKQFLRGELNCSCPSPCHEKSYDLQISSQIYPSPDYLHPLIDKVCKMGQSKKDVKACNKLIESNEYYKIRNFLKVNIFYRDLNYNELTEKPEYPWFTFLSDLGGAIGLFLGMSVLGIFEVFHLLCIIGYYLFQKCRLSGTLKRKTNVQPTTVPSAAIPMAPRLR